MRICIITSVFFPEVTGVSSHVSHMAGQFSSLGHDVLILCPDYGLEERLYPDFRRYQGAVMESVTVRPVPSSRNQRRAQSVNFLEGRLWNLEEYLDDFRPDIIQVEDPDRIYGVRLFGLEETIAYNDAIGTAYAKARRIPSIGFYHTNYGAFADYYIPGDVPTPFRLNPAGVYSLIYGAYDMVLCSCADAFRHLVERGVQKARQGIFVGIDEAFIRVSEKSRLVPQNNDVKLLYSGRFDGGKDVRLVIELFKKVGARNSACRLYLAGAGNEQTMAYVAQECGTHPGLVYLGSLERQELAKVYNSVDIYFSPHDTDTFGLSVIEAMAVALPAVVSDRGGPASLITHGVNGFLCRTEDEYVGRILELADNEGKRHAMGRRAKEYAEKYHGADCARNLLAVYRESILALSNERGPDVVNRSRSGG